MSKSREELVASVRAMQGKVTNKGKTPEGRFSSDEFNDVAELLVLTAEEGVQNLAGSASDEQTVVKAGNDSTNSAGVTVTKNGASIHGRAGDVTIDDDGVNISAGNSGFPNATVKVNGLPVATQQYVNNAAAALSENIRLEDGEDLTVHVTDGGKKELKLAEKPYAPAVFSGLGRKYLRKNYSVQDAVPFNGFVEGVTVETAGTVLTPTAIFFDTVNKWFVGLVGLKYYNAWQGNGDYEPVSETKTYVYNGKGYTWDSTEEALVEGEAVKNVLTQAMVNTANTIYHIQYDYDLNGETLTVPAGCVLEFDGGSVKNGTINGTQTTIDASLVKIFDTSIIFGGTWNVEYSFPEWWGEITNNVAYANALGVTKLQRKIYFVDTEVKVKNWIQGESSLFELTSGGARDYSRVSCICYIGNGGTNDEAYTDTLNSILLIEDTRMMCISNVAFFCAASRNINPKSLYVHDGGLVEITNKSFSAIRYVTTSVGAQSSLIENCVFQALPIGINLHDYSLNNEAAANKNGDNHRISHCVFIGNDYSIVVNNSAAYCVYIDHCCSHTANYRHVWIKMGHVNVNDGFYGPILGSDATIIKAAFYLGENAGRCSFTNVYTENHNGLAVYDESTRTLDDVTLLNCCLLHNASYNIDGVAYSIYNKNARRYNLISCRTSFAVYNGGSMVEIGSKTPSFAGVTDNVLHLGTPNQNVNDNTKVPAIGIKGRITLYNATQNNYIEATSNGFKLFKDGYGQLVINWQNKTFDWQQGYRLYPRTMTSLTESDTFGCFQRTSTRNEPFIVKAGIYRTFDGIKIESADKDPRQGDTANRPSHGYKLVGQMYFDTDLGKPIWWDGSNWVDATGTAV